MEVEDDKVEQLDEGKHVLDNLSSFNVMNDFNPNDYEVGKDLPAKKFYTGDKL